jgi:hypothetical protein
MCVCFTALPAAGDILKPKIISLSLDRCLGSGTLFVFKLKAANHERLRGSCGRTPGLLRVATELLVASWIACCWANAPRKPFVWWMSFYSSATGPHFGRTSWHATGNKRMSPEQLHLIPAFIFMQLSPSSALNIQPFQDLLFHLLLEGF